MDQALAQLVKKGVIDREIAEDRCANPEDLSRLVLSA